MGRARATSDTSRAVTGEREEDGLPLPLQPHVPGQRAIGLAAREQRLAPVGRQRREQGVGGEDRVVAPKAISFVPVLPRTATGKVRKHELRETEWAGHESRIQG